MKNHILPFFYAFLLLFALLYPFDFDFRINHAHWLGSENGIHFKKKGIIISKVNPIELCEKLTQGAGLTLEVWLKTDDLMQNGPARIFSYSLDTKLRNFTLAQSEDRLVMRLRTEQTDLNGIFPHMEIPLVFQGTQKIHVVVTYDFDKQCVFINGRLRQCNSSLKGNFSNWDTDFKLVVGNETNGDRPWLGEIYYAAIYDKALGRMEISEKYDVGILTALCSKPSGSIAQNHPVVCYQFDEKKGDQVTDKGTNALEIHLHIPVRVPWEMKMFQYNQLGELKNSVLNFYNLLHILIFIPGGVFLRRFVSTKVESVFLNLVLVLIIGIALSFGFEFLQHFLPGRNSTIIDVIANLIGLCLGFTFGQFWLKGGNSVPIEG